MYDAGIVGGVLGLMPLYTQKQPQESEQDSQPAVDLWCVPCPSTLTPLGSYCSACKQNGVLTKAHYATCEPMHGLCVLWRVCVATDLHP